jgi:nucleotide-binding universal stress UspA family protein
LGTKFQKLSFSKTSFLKRKNKKEFDMYKTILVPLDGSRRAEAILPQVEEIAHCFKAKVLFLQVIEPIFVYTGMHGYVGDAGLEENTREIHVQRAKDYLAGISGEFREKGIQAKLFVEEGPVVSTIINIAEREGTDLIAMASHGRTGLSHVFYGSVAAGVLHLVNRPLLLVRAKV